MSNPFAVPEFNSDKISIGMMEEYKKVLAPLIHYPVTLLEIGVQYGGSVQYWDRYLKHPEARIVGVDLDVPDIEVSDRVELVECDQNNKIRLQQLADRYGKFDLVIDDASHYKKETEICLGVFWPHLKSGGYYCIEDWAVGYFGDQLPQYAGMVDVITDMMTGSSDRAFSSVRVVLEEGKSMAFFQKK